MSSVHTTISTLEALQLRRTGTPSDGVERAMKRDVVDAAMEQGHEYLLERGPFRSVRTGEVVKPEFTRFSFPPRWHYDVLRALRVLRW